LNINPNQLTALESQLMVAPGATLAFFGDPSEGSMVITIGVNDPSGEALAPSALLRQARRGLRAEGQNVLRTGKMRMETRLEDQPVLMMARPGVLIAGTRWRATEDAAEEQGEPWVTPPLTTLAEQWPLTVALRRGETWLYAGARTQPDRIEGRVTVPGSKLTAAYSELGQAALRSAIRRGAWSAAMADVESLWAAEQRYHAQNDRWLTWPESRADEDAPHAMLSWTPYTESRYWVEASADGEPEVHVRLDADDDGRAAHLKRTRDGRWTQLSAPGIW